MVAGSRMRGASYHSLHNIFLFDALWTVLYPSASVLWLTNGSLDLLAYLFGSIFWIFAAAIVWGSAVGFVHNTRARKSCGGIPSDLYCSHYLSPGSLAWMEFMLCAVTLILASIWVRASRSRQSKVFTYSLYT
ncbi:hypothetical protein F5148DRAFT_448451 [Russula earlei]|uniref:Uncharacterized protein n=1 Tax=Russula earlei TaxID=71964 RepID=A0ACC0U107_9AGAM|nr:hypothetical protein F5148DRAFT_448451 [Russula earlei]